MSELLSTTALLDMSTKDQRATPPSVNGGHSSREGRAAIVRFVADQWRLGERLHYGGVQPFEVGVFARDLVATFGDGTAQRMSEGRFVYRCSTRSFEHVVIGAAELAR